MIDGRRDFEGRGKDWGTPLISRDGVPVRQEEVPLLDVTVGDGKYRLMQYPNGELVAYRHGERWRSLLGDNLVLALAQEIERLRAELEWARGKPLP